MNSEDLIRILPEGCETLSIKVDPNCEGLSYLKGERDTRFVTPELEVLQGISSGETSVVLVEAPAAVGKSMLARELARATGGLLWNLAEVQVGHFTFTGILAHCLSGSDFATVKEGISVGKYLVVLDALDETRLRSKDPNFFAFLSNVADACKSAGDRPGVVLFGRTDAITWTGLWFEELNVPYAHLRIMFFDRASAVAVIEKRLDWLCTQRHVPPRHRQQRKAFGIARDAVFERIGDMFGGENWANATVRSFLGYPPVLEGIAAYLLPGPQPPRDFFHRLTSDLNEMAMEVTPGPTSVWELLGKILGEILNREHLKVKKLVKERLEPTAKAAGWANWEIVFAPEEQRRRILAASSVKIQHGKLPNAMHGKVYEEYDEVVRQHVGEHPFLGPDQEKDLFAGVVFRDDTYAWLLTAPNVEDEALVRLGDRLLKDFRPSPILAQSLLARRAAQRLPLQVRAMEVGMMYESLYALNDQVELRLTSGSANVLDGEIRGVGDLPIAFVVADVEDEIVFPLHLANADIRVRRKVRLGTQGFPFYLGPSVRVECSSLWIAPDLTVNTGSAETSIESRLVRLIAETCEHAAQRPRVDGQGNFKVTWPQIHPNWETYFEPPLPTANDEAEFGKEMMRALEVVARRNYGFLDLTNEDVRKDFPERVLSRLWNCGILKERTRAIRGEAGMKPELDRDVVSALVDNVSTIAQGVLPDSVRERLRKAQRS
jgi:hypothetical protein